MTDPVLARRAPPAITGNIYLVGLMGAGKTSVGKLLAKRLSRQFHDSDHEIEARTGVRIPVIFEIEGEAGFRQRESSVIDELTQADGIVLATGGGAVLDPRNRELLHSRGTVVYLRASVDELYNRTRRDRNRPLLQTADPRGRLAELMKVRDPLYREVAHIILDTGSQSLRTLIGRLEAALARHQPPKEESPPC